MKTWRIIGVCSVAANIVFAGCISKPVDPEREYQEWILSADGDDAVSYEMFLSDYRDGWRERAQKKYAEMFRKDANQ